MMSITNINEFYELSQEIVKSEITFDSVTCFFIVLIDISCILFFIN